MKINLFALTVVLTQPHSSAALRGQEAPRAATLNPGEPVTLEAPQSFSPVFQTELKEVRPGAQAAPVAASDLPVPGTK
jgi:hypothetical protein